jgi:hypothetical protein
MFILALVVGLLTVAVGANITKQEVRAVLVISGIVICLAATLGQFVYILSLLGKLLERVT